LRFTFDSNLAQYCSSLRTDFHSYQYILPSRYPGRCHNFAFRSLWLFLRTSRQYHHAYIHTSSPIKGYFCARFDQDTTPKASYGVIQNGTISFPYPQNKTAEGPLLSAFAKFPTSKSDPSQQTVITLRIGTSFISEDQARNNIDAEIPSSSSSSSSNDKSTTPTKQLQRLISGTFENTAYRVRKSWADILDRIGVEPWLKNTADRADSADSSLDIVDLQSFWTAAVHTFQVGIVACILRRKPLWQCPYEQHEQNRYYSGYDNTVHQLE
jgi:hypothetical protein